MLTAAAEDKNSAQKGAALGHKIICPSNDAIENTRKFVKVKLVAQNQVGKGWWVSQNMELLCSLQAQLIQSPGLSNKVRGRVFFRGQSHFH